MPEIRDLSFAYDGTPVFSGLNLSLPAGEKSQDSAGLYPVPHALRTVF